MDEEKNILLTISLLVSNRLDTIRNCMESLCPILEQIPSELIVVDTVGEENSDGSLAIAKEYATKVVHFPWCNDFAAARNAGLSRAEGQWFLFLDDDEWFEDVEEIIRFFRTGEYVNYNSATYQIRNYTNREGTTYNIAVLSRIIRRTADTCFVGRIHETFNEIKLPCKDFSSYAHHYGYVYDNAEEKLAHQKRNVELLKKELEQDPENLRYRAQMALELANYDNEGPLAFCEETFELCGKERQKNHFQWQLSLVFRLYEALGKKSATADAKYVELKENFGYNETSENAISYQMVRIHLINNVPEKAYPYAVKYFKTLRFLQEHPEQKQLQMTADFSRYQNRAAYLEMLHFGAYSAWRAKAYEDAWSWYMELPWESNEFPAEEAFQFMIQLFQEMPSAKGFITVAAKVMKNKSLISKPYIRNTISEILGLLKK